MRELMDRIDGLSQEEKLKAIREHTERKRAEDPEGVAAAQREARELMAKALDRLETAYADDEPGELNDLHQRQIQIFRQISERLQNRSADDDKSESLVALIREQSALSERASVLGREEIIQAAPPEEREQLREKFAAIQRGEYEVILGSTDPADREEARKKIEDFLKKDL